MFRCDNCGGQQPKSTKSFKAVVERRDVEYKDANGKVLGKGWEIVRELTLGGCCRELFPAA
jgi:hypothetical protein